MKTCSPLAARSSAEPQSECRPAIAFGCGCAREMAFAWEPGPDLVPESTGAANSCETKPVNDELLQFRERNAGFGAWGTERSARLCVAEW